MLREATYSPAAVNVLDVSSESMAAFQVFLYGRFWVFTEDRRIVLHPELCVVVFGHSSCHESPSRLDWLTKQSLKQRNPRLCQDPISVHFYTRAVLLFCWHSALRQSSQEKSEGYMKGQSP
jgi:hypothetical protein